MLNDIDKDIGNVRAQSDKPVYLRILDIKRRGYSPRGKTLEIRCVQKRRKRTYGQYQRDEAIELHYIEPRNNYIAVSCPWELPISDNVTTGKYRIDPYKDMEIFDPQDAVLDRVMNFVKYDEESSGMPFWIDKLCIDQRDGSDEKEIAIQSMDLIYKQSTLSLGLLFVRIGSKEQIERLRDLMRGNCIVKGHIGQEKDEYSLKISRKEAREVLDVLYLIIEDPWWERAWIFQEEYLSGDHMRLLIRSSQARYQSSSKLFGNVPGELKLSAVKFREKSTRFCLAFREQSGISEEEKSRCAEILKRAGKYNILLLQQTAGSTLKGMSPTIFEDIGQRNTKFPLDKLVIAANSCGYSERLNTRILRKEKESLSLAILTIFILNGEILRHDSNAGKHLDGNIFEFLKNNTMDIEPPLEEKQLTFIKLCRFPNVALLRAGITTEGIIWKLGKTINTDDFCWTPQEEFDSPRSCKNSITSLDRETLWLLYKKIKMDKELAESLSTFLKNTPERFVKNWTWKHIMHMMARSVARAIKGGKQLQLGSVYRCDGYSPYTAIFVRENASQPDNGCFAFTSWTCAEEVTEGNLMESSGSKYASLEVDYHYSVAEPPKIVPQRWINGLCFFSNSDANGVIIPWPKSIGDWGLVYYFFFFGKVSLTIVRYCQVSCAPFEVVGYRAVLGQEEIIYIAIPDTQTRRYTRSLLSDLRSLKGCLFVTMPLYSHPNLDLSKFHFHFETLAHVTVPWAMNKQPWAVAV